VSVLKTSLVPYYYLCLLSPEMLEGVRLFTGGSVQNVLCVCSSILRKRHEVVFQLVVFARSYSLNNYGVGLKKYQR